MTNAMIYERARHELVGYAYIVKRFKVSKATAFRWIHDGKFGQPAKMGNTLRVKRSEVDKAIAKSVEDFDSF